MSCVILIALVCSGGAVYRGLRDEEAGIVMAGFTGLVVCLIAAVARAVG